MSKENQSDKYYWAYKPSNLNGITLFFDTLEEAKNYAVPKDTCNEVRIKDDFIFHKGNMFFRIRKDEIHKHSPAERGRISK